MSGQEKQLLAFQVQFNDNDKILTKSLTQQITM
jgi:hypothetical protein